MLSVFITPCMKPTACHWASSSPVSRDTVRSSASTGWGASRNAAKWRSMT